MIPVLDHFAGARQHEMLRAVQEQRGPRRIPTEDNTHFAAGEVSGFRSRLSAMASRYRKATTRAKHSTKPSRAILGAAALLLAVLATACGDGASAESTDVSDLLDEVRAATAEYRDLDAALAVGYEQSSECVPNMGYHYTTGIAETAAGLDPVEPNLLVYAPNGGGDLELVAVEYGTDAEDAELFGVPFDPPGDPGPPFSTLHAWVWLGNPDGTFASLNPLVSCD